MSYDGLDQFENLIIQSNERDIESLSRYSLRFNYLIYVLYKSSSFWKRRVEYLIDTTFDNLDIDWYNIYNKIYDKRRDERLSDDELLNLSDPNNPDKELVKILGLSGFKLAFLTGNDDVDMMIILGIDDLNEVISNYNNLKIIRPLLDREENFDKLRKKYHLQPRYIKSMKELSILRTEINKTKVKMRKLIIPRKIKGQIRNKELDIYDFRVGDRIIANPFPDGSNMSLEDNYVITDVEGVNYKLFIKNVDLFGNLINPKKKL